MASERKVFLSYLAPRRRSIIVGAFLVTTSILVGLAIPFILRFVIDDLTAGYMTTQRLLVYSAWYLGAAIASAGAGMGMRRVMLAVGFNVERDVREDLFAQLTRLDGSFFRRERTGDIMTKMSADLQSLGECVGQGFLQGFRTLVGFVFGFAVMFAVNVRMALVMLFLLPATSVIFFFLLRRIRRRYEEAQDHYSTVSNFAQENFAGVRVVKGFGIEPRQRSLFEGLNLEWIRRQLALSRVERPVFPLMAFLFGIGVALILLIGGRQVLQGRLTLGELVQFNLYLYFLQWPMLALGWTTNLLQRGATSWKRVRTILDAEPRIADADWTDHTLDAVGGDIEFRDVSLHGKGRPILENISLVIPEGATVGITGPTGCGKTALVSMVPRLLNPSLGEVRIGGRDVREYPLDTLRRNIGMAPQEPFLFSDTLGQNIAYGLPEEYDQQVLWAAEVAQLRSDVEDFPSGFDTVLGERGVTLSGGQRQRTAISRAIAHQPALLILDDVFSAIDTQTEARIIQQLRSVLEGRTSIIISHRVSTLRDADFIVVLEGGRITQQGTHEELTRQAGYYRSLDETQRLEARLEAG